MGEEEYGTIYVVTVPTLGRPSVLNDVLGIIYVITAKIQLNLR